MVNKQGKRGNKTDLLIIGLLKENSRRSNTWIARELDVSEGTVRRRLDTMIAEGIFTPTIAMHRPDGTAILRVRALPVENFGTVEAVIKEHGVEIDEVLQIVGTSNNATHQLTLNAPTNADIFDLMLTLNNMKGVMVVDMTLARAIGSKVATVAV